MRWPIDDRSDQDLAGYLYGLGVGRQVKERLLLERNIAMRHGFACFADYFMARRERGWATAWLTKRDKPGIGCGV